MRIHKIGLIIEISYLSRYIQFIALNHRISGLKLTGSDKLLEHIATRVAIRFSQK